MKRFIISFSILAVIIVIILFFGYQRVINITIDKLLNQINTGPTRLVYQQATFSFPRNIRIVDLSLFNDDFSFHAPQINISFDWGLLFGQDKRIIANIPKAEILSNSKNLFQNMRDFQFQVFPNFEIDIKNLSFPNEVLTSKAFPVYLQKKDKIISFRINHPKLSINGDYISEEKIKVDYSFLDKENPLQGQLIFSLIDDTLKGTVQSGMKFSFTTLLLHKEDGVEFQNLKIQNLAEGENTIKFLGESRIWLNNHPKIQINGKVTGGASKDYQDLDLELQLDNISEIAGRFHLKTKEPSLEIKSDLIFFPKNSSFSLHLLPGSIVEENPIEGEIKGNYANQQVNIEFVSQPMDFRFSDITGKGTIKGNASLTPKSFKVKGQLNSEWMQFGNYQVEQILMQFQYDHKKMLFQAIGRLFEGELLLDGSYFDQQFKATGTLKNGNLKNFIGEAAPPLEGSISGLFEIHQTKSEPFSISLSITDGNLSWKDIFIGNQITGKLNYWGDKLLVTDLSLHNQNGVIEGEIEKEYENLKGWFRFKDFPFTFPIAERTFGLVGEGSGEFQYSKGQWKITGDFYSPVWNYEKWSGTDFEFRGEISPNEIIIEKCETQILGGNLSVSGKVIPFKEINLTGTISNLVFPDNVYQFQGTIQEISLKAQGLWDKIAFGMSGQGEGLTYQGQPLGESFQIVIEGVSNLPKEKEKISLERYLNPEILKKGIIQIQGAHFEQEIEGGYQVVGQADIEAQLDVSKKIWFIKSQNLNLKVGEFLDFTGFIQGSLKNDQIDIQQIHLKENARNINLIGKGYYNLKDQIIQGQFTGQYDDDLSFPDYGIDVYLAGNTELNLSGTINKPQYEGWIQINQGKVMQKGKELIQLEDIYSTVKGKELLISKGHGQWLGFDFTTEGTVEETGVNLTFNISGKNSLLGQFDYFQGYWQGKVTLRGLLSDLQAEGVIQVKNGFIDTTHLDQSQSSTVIFQNLDKSFQNIPLKLKLVLKTDDTFRVKTQFLDLKLTGELVLDNSEDSMKIKGRLEVVEGTYDLVMRTIPIQGYVVFGDYFGLIPQIHLEGQIEVNHNDIILKADGPLDEYEMKLQSEPPLLQEEILSLLFVGDKEAYQSLDTLDLEPHLLSALRFFLGMKETGLKNVLFFDSIELVAPNPENKGFYGIELEKALGENASISYTHDLSGGDNSTWNLELDFNREWSFKSEFGSNGKYGWELEFKARF